MAGSGCTADDMQADALRLHCSLDFTWQSVVCNQHIDFRKPTNDMRIAPPDQIQQAMIPEYLLRLMMLGVFSSFRNWQEPTCS